VLKRLFDLLAAALGLVVLSPVFLIVAVAIKLDSVGPVFFRQERVGRYGRTFRIFKFRTMTVGSPQRAQLTVGGDVRITRTGHFLRRYKIDELAQLIDVFRGTMSLVGPRPEVPRYVAAYPPKQRERILSVRPGITDFASILYRDENSLLAEATDPEREYLDVILPQKLRFAVNYVDHATLSSDIKVLGLTVKTVFVSERSLQALRNLMRHQGFWRQVSGFMTLAHDHRRWIQPCLDGVAVLATWHLTYLFRLGFERWQPGRPWYDDYVSMGVVAVYLGCLSLSGIRRSMWRFFAFDDFRRLLVACLSAGLICAVVILMMQLVGVARAVLVLHPLFTLLALVMMRSLYRIVHDHAHSISEGYGDEPRYAVVLGAGQIARRLIAGLHRRDGWFVLMVLDDDAGKHGTRIGGVPVEGAFDLLRNPGLTFKATHAIIALDDGTPEDVDALANLAAASGLTVMSVPRAQDLSVVEPLAPDQRDVSR
jgi:lipopolysaccharide/colanic/teichoic acid biosynthesis glycosyltransferase